MDLSETIVAAMIGGIATVTTALFQIFSSIKNRSKLDVRPRRGSTMRSILAVMALMIASAVGGFLYAELLKQREGDELRAMRMELRELKEITTAARAAALPATSVAPESPQSAVPVALAPGAQSVESVTYVPACRRSHGADLPFDCTEADAQRIALCGSIPAYARLATIDLFAQPDAMQKPWEEHRAALEQDLGGARFTGRSFEYAQGEERKAVCVNFVHWSSEHSHIARIVIHYAWGEAANPAPPIEAAPAVIAADALPAMPHQASFVTTAPQ
jgi:hypothetical protein